VVLYSLYRWLGTQWYSRVLIIEGNVGIVVSYGIGIRYVHNILYIRSRLDKLTAVVVMF